MATVDTHTLSSNSMYGYLLVHTLFSPGESVIAYPNKFVNDVEYYEEKDGHDESSGEGCMKTLGNKKKCNLMFKHIYFI